MDVGENGSANWLGVAEAAPLLGLTVDGLRSRIRRGLVTTRKGNDGRLLVSVSANAPARPVTNRSRIRSATGRRNQRRRSYAPRWSSCG